MASKKKVSKKATKKTTSKATQAKTKASQKKAQSSSNTESEGRLDQLQDLLQSNLDGLNADKAEQLAKNIWLAGLGAYSRTFDEIAERVDDFQDRYENINSEGQKVFEDLVERGGEIQDDLEGAVKRGRENLEDRVEEFKQRFGGGLSSFVDIPSRLRDAAERIEEISEKLQNKKSK